MNKLLIATALTATMTMSGCAVGIQLAAHTAVGVARHYEQKNSVVIPEDVFDVIEGNGIYINGEYSATAGLKGTYVDTFM